MINRSETTSKRSNNHNNTNSKEASKQNLWNTFCLFFFYFGLVWWQVAKAIKNDSRKQVSCVSERERERDRSVYCKLEAQLLPHSGHYSSKLAPLCAQNLFSSSFHSIPLPTPSFQLQLTTPFIGRFRMHIWFMGSSHAAPPEINTENGFSRKSRYFSGKSPFHGTSALPQKSAGSAVGAALPASAVEGLRRAPSNRG